MNRTLTDIDPLDLTQNLNLLTRSLTTLTLVMQFVREVRGRR